eukprot:366089-Chlamydomonas_euryale.AAC.2
MPVARPAANLGLVCSISVATGLRVQHVGREACSESLVAIGCMQSDAAATVALYRPAASPSDEEVGASERGGRPATGRRA